MKKKIFVLMVILLMVGCTPSLDTRLLDMIRHSCSCNATDCLCRDYYSDDFIYIRCEDVDLVEITDVMENCNYGFVADDGKMHWERFPYKIDGGG
jgi:hypothetical protein